MNLFETFLVDLKADFEAVIKKILMKNMHYMVDMKKLEKC